MWQVHEEELYKQIFKEFEKTKEDLYAYINILRSWADTQPHFPEKPSDNVLRFVILVNKFSIEKAKERLDMYYTIRTLMPEFYKSQPLSPEMISQRKIVYCVPLPKTTPDFKRIIFGQFNPKFGAEFFDNGRLVENFCNLMELLLQEDKCYNYHIIFDCIGIRLGHLPKISPMSIRKASIILEKVYSNRIASLYMVNFPQYMETILNTVIKPMLNKKIRERVQIHSGSDILLERFGKEILPIDIGGNEKSLEELTDCLHKKYEERIKRFEAIRTLQVDESLRPKKLVNDDVLGYYGSFRKINVD